MDWMSRSKATRSEPIDHVSQAYSRRRWTWLAILAGILTTLFAVIYWLYLIPIPVDYSKDSDHFLYGSIGSDAYDGIPLAIWKILPETFPEYLPNEGRDYKQLVAARKRKAAPLISHLDGYSQFGFLIQGNNDLPIGFSQRRLNVDRVGLNCGVCHTGTVRVRSSEEAERIYDGETKPEYVGTAETSGAGRVLIYGMPAHTLDLEAYFTFLFKCASDRRFTSDNLISAIDQSAERNNSSTLGSIERFLLKQGVGTLRETLMTRKQQLHYLSMLPHEAGEEATPRFGPGRIDTFSPYKSIQFGFPYDGTYGIADYPSIWNQRPRTGMNLHWDGNNKSVFERNISASLGAGVTPVSLDMHRMLRVARWIGSPPPSNQKYAANFANQSKQGADANRPFRGEMQIPNYPFHVDLAKASEGHLLYREYCARCHGDWTQAGQNISPSTDKFPGLGQVVGIGEIGTDAARLDSYTEALQANQNQLGAGQWWRFSNFRKTNGYANSPLDGIWARAPYLHNGSVPTLDDLFNRPCSVEDCAELGITPETDIEALGNNPTQVAALIANARSLGLRPPVFYRGDDEYDETRGGFRCDRERSQDGRKLFLYSTVRVVDGRVQTLLGNGHQGHYENEFADGASFGTELTGAKRSALIEFQKLIGSEQAKGLP